MNNFYGLWTHPHTSDAKRKEFVNEAFVEVILKGRDIVRVVPRPTYVPLFARSVYLNRGGYGRGERSQADSTHLEIVGVEELIEFWDKQARSA